MTSENRLSTLLQSEPYWTARAMQEQGSRFYRHLGEALAAADAVNRRVLYQTWPDAAWDFYQRGLRLEAQESGGRAELGRAQDGPEDQSGSSTRPPTLLAVFAHPDDEAFSVGGTLTHYARRGVRVVVACATRGEAGKITVPGMTVDDLGAQREQELRAACRALEIEPPVFLDFHDSGRFERTRYDDPLALMNADLREVEARIRDVIADLNPDVMVTFDPHGGYGHIDHLQIHRAATAAFFSTGHLPGGGPQRLYYTALTPAAAEGLSRMGEALDPLLYGVSEGTVAVRMDVRAYAEQKKAALAAHGTQMGEQSLLGRMSAEERQAMEEQMLGVEHFSVGGTRTALHGFPLRGLFDGLSSVDD